MFKKNPLLVAHDGCVVLLLWLRSLAIHLEAQRRRRLNRIVLGGILTKWGFFVVWWPEVERHAGMRCDGPGTPFQQRLKSQRVASTIHCFSSRVDVGW